MTNDSHVEKWSIKDDKWNHLCITHTPDGKKYFLNGEITSPQVFNNQLSDIDVFELYIKRNASNWEKFKIVSRRYVRNCKQWITSKIK